MGTIYENKSFICLKTRAVVKPNSVFQMRMYSENTHLYEPLPDTLATLAVDSDSANGDKVTEPKPEDTHVKESKNKPPHIFSKNRDLVDTPTKSDNNLSDDEA